MVAQSPARLAFDCRFLYQRFELNLRFEAGHGVTALYGPSGSGKSTTLALIAGLLRPHAGFIRLGERVLVDVRAGVFVPPEKRHVGIVFQDHLLFPHLSVRQNLQFGRRKNSAAAAITFDRVVQVLEIGDLLERRPDAISGGQKQRVALGRALLSGPEILLMDEPLSALDQNLKDRILTYLDRVAAEWHIPTLFVSHDQADVRRLADDVVVIEAGQSIAAGATAEMFDEAVLRRMKQRAAPVNLLRVTNLRCVDGHWEGDAAGQRLHLPGGDYQAGSSVHVQFHPHDVMLSDESAPGISARNRLAGTVREIVELPDGDFVAIDAGQFLWAQITPEAARDLHLAPGKPIVCIVKTFALTVLT